jgi:hypothetical protein
MDPDPTFHFDTGPDPDPTPNFTYVGKSPIIPTFSTAAPVCSRKFFLSHRHHSVIIFNIFYSY